MKACDDGRSTCYAQAFDVVGKVWNVVTVVDVETEAAADNRTGKMSLILAPQHAYRACLFQMGER